MVICEKCGAYYKPSAQAPDCPECAAAGRKSGAPAAKPAASAVRPAASAAKAGAPAPVRSRPAAAPAAAKAAAPAEGARARAAEQPVRRAASPPTRTAAKAAPAHEPTPVHHHKNADAETLDKNSKIGLICAGALAAIVCIVLFVVNNKHKEDERIRLEFENQVSALYDKMKSLNINEEAGANQIIQLANEKESVWKLHPLAAQIMSLRGSAVSSLATNQERNSAISDFDALEKRVNGSESLPAEKIRDLRRSLEEMAPRIPLAGPEVEARFAAARTTADRTYATKLVDDAKALADSEASNPRLALQRYQTAEDELKGMVDAAYAEKNEEKKTFYTELYKRVVEQSNRFTEQVFTADASEKLPWVDCLAGTKVNEWVASPTKGFAHRIENGVLSLVGPDPEAKAKGVIAIGDKEQWRSFILDMEFTIEKGGVEMCFRLGKNANKNTVYLDLATEGENKEGLLTPGKTYRAKASLIGSEFRVRYADDMPRPIVDTLDWTKSRKGAIGFLVPPGARIKFTRFLVRELH